MWKWLKGWLQGNNDPLKTVFEGIDNLVTSVEEKETLRLRALELQLKREEQKLSDKANARSMYKLDSSIQKLLALVFLIGYLALSGFLLYWFFNDNLELNQVTSNFLYLIFGAMSSKLNTIIDFYFGGSTPDNSPDVKKLIENKQQVDK